MSDEKSQVPARIDTVQSVQSSAPAAMPSAEFLEKFLMQQAEQIAVRKDELELEKQQDKHSYEYAQSSLKAQAEDRGQQRQSAKSARRDRLIFAAFGVIVLGGFVIYTLYLGKDEFAKETLKALVFLLAGGLGGYSIGKNARPRPSNNSNQDSPLS